MPGYDFYCTEFHGGSIPSEDFCAYASRAEQEIKRLERLYTVTGTESERKLAVCAVADVLYYFDCALSGAVVKSVSIGSVSESGMDIDTSTKAQKKEIYRAACLHLEIYRGVKSCG
ncbi:MAG: hypothetical protein E7547_02860 [Ruminococcaceae bacterium]|nr:hypothetical protein [Oscillospiraceae bacterium]